MLKAGAVVVGVALAMAACGSGGDDAAGSSGEPSSTTAQVAETTTSTTAAPLSVPDAATQYMAIVDPYNRALEALEQAVNIGQGLDAVRQHITALVAANATQIEQLGAVAWPDVVQPAVTELLAESELAQEAWVRAEQATSMEAMVTELIAAGEHDGSTPAGTIRDLLGLDEYDESDYQP